MQDSRPARQPASSADRPTTTRLDRRRWLATSGRGVVGIGAASMLSALGCRSEEPTQTADGPTVRTDVPLRVLWAGSEDEAALVRRTWQSISDQPVAITVVEPPEKFSAAVDQKNASDEFWRSVRQNDVLVYPLIDVGQLVSSDGWMPIVRRGRSSETTGRDATDAILSNDELPPALEVAASYGGEPRGMLLGGFLPALLLGESLLDESSPSESAPAGQPTSAGNETAVATWKDFHQLARQHPQRVAEPLTPMWAGCSYLWRAASSITATWLFDRDDLQPLIDRPEYVAVLEQMRETAQYQPESPATPGQIYQNVAAGKWLAGIGFPIGGDEPAGSGAEGEQGTADRFSPTSVTIKVTAVPAAPGDDEASATRDFHRQMLDPFCLVGSLSAACRQTAAATAFLNWLAGGEGSDPVYRSMPRLIDRTIQPEASQDAAAPYRRWWNSRVESPNVVPPLQLIQGRRYHQILDRQVRDCLDGNCTAAEATTRIAERWNELHRTVGIKQQQRAWRRALGFL